MKHVNTKAGTALALTLLLLAGCGGGSSDPFSTGSAVQGGAGTAVGPTVITVAGIVKYLTDLMAGTSDATEPTNANAVELAVDDTAEPAAL